MAATKCAKCSTKVFAVCKLEAGDRRVLPRAAPPAAVALSAAGGQHAPHVRTRGALTRCPRCPRYPRSIWHVDCFRCATCACQLSAASFATDAEGALQCLKHGPKLTGA
jgi:hypothetical protein